MKFISYAQNFEDVILERAFKGQGDGFYIDVGAADPVKHSVTKSFYERGWSGINIEPGSDFFRQLEADRGRDINLNVGLSDRVGEVTFFEAPESLGLSTFTASWRSDWALRDGVKFVEKTVPVLTLAEVCERHAGRPIDFLKIDVEGHEQFVIEGGDFERWRPRVVVVEGDRQHYQNKLLASGYLHAAWDGINHYFVSREEDALIGPLSAPVSLVNDQFELHEYASQIHELRRALEWERSRAEAARSELEGRPAFARIVETPGLVAAAN